MCMLQITMNNLRQDIVADSDKVHCFKVKSESAVLFFLPEGKKRNT